eukprot:g18096.t1
MLQSVARRICSRRRAGSAAGGPELVAAAAARGDAFDGRAERMYISNDVFHCNELSCQQYWNRWELQSFYEVPFGLTVARVPSGAASYLERVYGWDWNITVRPHGWASQHGEGFEAKEVASLHKRAAEPFGPLPHVL